MHIFPPFGNALSFVDQRNTPVDDEHRMRVPSALCVAVLYNFFCFFFYSVVLYIKLFDINKWDMRTGYTCMQHAACVCDAYIINKSQASSAVD